MKTTADYLNELRAKLGATTDGQLIKHTGWHRQMISRYRRERTSFDDETAMRVADWLGCDPHQIIADMDAQRALRTRSEKVRQEIARMVAGAAIAVLAVWLLPYSLPPDQDGATSGAMVIM